MQSSQKSAVERKRCNREKSLQLSPFSAVEQNLCSRGKSLQSTLHTAVFTSDDSRGENMKSRKISAVYASHCSLHFGRQLRFALKSRLQISAAGVSFRLSAETSQYWVFYRCTCRNSPPTQRSQLPVCTDRQHRAQRTGDINTADHTPPSADHPSRRLNRLCALGRL